MEPQLALQTATVLLAMGAVRPPSSFSMGHGLLAGAALTLLLYACLTVGLPGTAQLATLLLIVAAIGGVFINLRYHDRMQPLPMPLLVVHALLAVAGFGLLLVALDQIPAA